MIYLLDPHPHLAAKALCDKHLRMAMLAAKEAAIRVRENRTEGAAPHIRWACSTQARLKWAVQHGQCAFLEYHARRRKFIETKTIMTLDELMPDDTYSSATPLNELINEIDKRRDSYALEFKGAARWTNRYPPDWMASR